MLADIIKNNIDILIISEAKIDQFFPEGKFQLYGNSEPERSDRDGNGGGILLFIPENIPSKLIESKIRQEGFVIELSPKRKLCL